MTIEETSTVDPNQASEERQNVNLIVTDHIGRPATEDQANKHEYMLQTKVNSYPSYVECGQLAQDYPQTAGMSVRVLVHGKFDRPVIVIARMDSHLPR